MIGYWIRTSSPPGAPDKMRIHADGRRTSSNVEVSYERSDLHLVLERRGESDAC